MKHITYIFFFFSGFIFAQSGTRLVLTNDVYINLNGGTESAPIYLVVDNSLANAITTSNGNILSEGENNLIKWNLRGQTGNYEVPWTSISDVKLPLTVQVTNGGSSDGVLLLSTYRTADAWNNSYPQWPGFPVDHMNSDALEGADASLHTIDRFWKIDASSYTTKPAVTISFTYDMNNEGALPNEITGNLRAQRWNSADATWGGGYYMWGTDNGTDKVQNAVIPVAEFYENWTLVDVQTPLPIHLIDFSVICDAENSSIYWSTASETDSDYFIVEKSRNGIDWEAVATIDAAGNSNSMIEYQVLESITNLTYYRLLQVDFDGRTEVYGPISANCNASTSSWGIHPVPVIDDATLVLQTVDSFDGKLVIVDQLGQLVYEEEVSFHSGTNHHPLHLRTLSPATYTIYLRNNQHFKPLKLLKL